MNYVYRKGGRDKIGTYSVGRQLSDSTYYRIRDPDTTQPFVCGVMQQCAEFHHVTASSLSLPLTFVTNNEADFFAFPHRQAMPRTIKSFSSQKLSHSAPATCVVSSSKRKQWTGERMTAALKAVEGARASRDFEVPRSTLHDCISRRVVHGVNLNEAEEKELSSYLKHCAKVGYGKTRKGVLCIVKSATSECGCLRTSHLSNGWWRRFKEHQGDISLNQGDSAAHMHEDRCNKSEDN